MNKLTRYITPLSVLFIISLPYGVWVFYFARYKDHDGVGALYLSVFAVPSLLFNVLINKFIKNKLTRNTMQFVSIVVIVATYFILTG